MRPRERIAYLDNAATSWPKPPGVAAAITRFIEEDGGNPGRSGHRLSLAAGRTVSRTRESLAELLGVSDPLRVVFTSGATESLNLALRGYLRAGDRVVVDAFAHNASMRPLAALAREGVTVAVAPPGPDGRFCLERWEAALSGGHGGKKARMAVLTHASNVSGLLADLEGAADVAARHDAFLLVDAAQTAGSVPLRLDSYGAAAVAVPGHKGLLGPQGVGALAFSAGADWEAFSPLNRGGTGSKSESEEQPDFLPDRFESGTPNGPGIAGLGAALDWIREEGGIEAMFSIERSSTDRLLKGLAAIPGLEIVGSGVNEALERSSAVSFKTDRIPLSDLALELDDRFGVLCRVGLHCAPRAHRSLGTFPGGAVRLSPGPFTTDSDIDAALDGIRVLLSEYS